jgi:outer membrane protein
MDAGVKAEVPLPWRGTSLSAKIVNDALSRHDGQVAEMSLSKELAGSIWRLMPSAGARIQSGRMTNYYYGVRPDEARADRSEYGPGATVNYFADAMFIFGAPKGWIVITRGGVEFLADEIHKSPIVKKDVLFNGVVGLARKF